MNHSKVALVILSGLGLTACVEQVTPEWEAYFSTVENNNNIEWLKRTESDIYGDIVIAGSHVIAGPDRNEDALLVKYDNRGNLVWSKTLDASVIEGQTSDEKFTDLVVDGADIYVVGQRTRRSEAGVEQSSFVARFDQDGNQIWETQISAETDAWDLEVANGLIYVTGYQTQVLSLDGDVQLTLASPANGEYAWDIEADSIGNFYVGSRYGVTKYNALGEVLWKNHVNQASAEARYFNVSIELNNNGQIAYAAMSQNNSNANVSVLSEQGNVLWQTTMSKSDSATLQSQPSLVAVGNNWLVSISDQASRKVSKFNGSGRQQWQFSDANGPVLEMAVLDNGRIVMTGSGKSAVLDANGTQIAEHVQSGAQALTGSLTVQGNEVFIANTRSVSGKGLMGYVAKFSDQ